MNNKCIHYSASSLFTKSIESETNTSGSGRRKDARRAGPSELSSLKFKLLE